MTNPHSSLLYVLLASVFLTGFSHAESSLERFLKEQLFGKREHKPFDREDERIPSYEIRSTESGRGTFKRRGGNQLLNEASVILDRDGRAEIRVSGTDRYRFIGIWRRGEANQALLTISQTYDRSPATATGSVTLVDGTFRRLRLKGNAAALDGPFELGFTAQDSDGIRPAPSFSLDQTRRGRGSFIVGQSTERLSQARLLLERDGTARLSVFGERDYAFAGVWARRSDKVVDLRFTRGPGRGAIDLAGNVTLNASGFGRIEVAGDAPALGGRARVNFTGSEREYVERRHNYRGSEAPVGGRGTIRVRGGQFPLNQGSVRLYQNGTARIDFRGQHAYSMEGTWFHCQDRTALELEIDQLNNRPAAATGRLLIHDDGEVHGIEVQGTADVTRGTFSLGYRAAGHDHEEAIEDRRNQRRPLPAQAIDTTVTGTGRYVSRATNTLLDRARIQLRADSTAILTFSGRDTLTFTGPWRMVRPGVAQVSLEGLQNRIPVTGTATIQLDGRDTLVSAVSLSGSSRQRGSFELSFRTSARPQWNIGRGLKDRLQGIF